MTSAQVDTAAAGGSTDPVDGDGVDSGDQPDEPDESDDELADDEYCSDLLEEDNSGSEVDSDSEEETNLPPPAAGRGRGRGKAAPKPAAAAGRGKQPAAARAPTATGAAKYKWVEPSKHKWTPRQTFAGSELPTLASSLSHLKASSPVEDFVEAFDAPDKEYHDTAANSELYRSYRHLHQLDGVNKQGEPKRCYDGAAKIARSFFAARAIRRHPPARRRRARATRRRRRRDAPSSTAWTATRRTRTG